MVKYKARERRAVRRFFADLHLDLWTKKRALELEIENLNKNWKTMPTPAPGSGKEK